MSVPARAASAGSFADFRLDLEARFKEVCRELRAPAVCLGYQLDGESCFLGHGDLSGTSPQDFSVPLGCLMKPVTATLVAHSISSGKLSFTSDVGTLLSTRSLRGVQVRHLLNHTHGVDGAAVPELPRSPDGLIDVAALTSDIESAERLHEPGQMYNYGHVGSWLAGAILEIVERRRYAELVSEAFEDPSLARHDLCPARGGTSRFAVGPLLRFFSQHTRADETSAGLLPAALFGLRAEVFQLPGWHPILDRICLGWNQLGDRWFSHKGTMDEHSALVKLNPQAGVTIVVLAEGTQTAASVFSGIFGSQFPPPRTPWGPGSGLLRANEAASLDGLTGAYIDAGTRLQFDVAANGSLRATMYRNDVNGSLAAEPAVKRLLRPAGPARPGLFLPLQPGGVLLPFVQFVRCAPKPGYPFVQVGQCLYRRA